jgi:hypothetical protein
LGLIDFPNNIIINLIKIRYVLNLLLIYFIIRQSTKNISLPLSGHFKCQRGRRGRDRMVIGFTPGTPVSPTNKTYHHDITKILLKVALSTITLTLKCQGSILMYCTDSNKIIPMQSYMYLEHILHDENYSSIDCKWYLL